MCVFSFGNPVCLPRKRKPKAIRRYLDVVPLAITLVRSSWTINQTDRAARPRTIRME